jgi:hypothetical protein
MRAEGTMAMTANLDVLDVISDDAWLMTEESSEVQVVPMQEDEFTCSCCFLIHHRSQRAVRRRGRWVCRDCA